MKTRRLAAATFVLSALVVVFGAVKSASALESTVTQVVGHCTGHTASGVKSELVLRRNHESVLDIWFVGFRPGPSDAQSFKFVPSDSVTSNGLADLFVFEGRSPATNFALSGTAGVYVAQVQAVGSTESVRYECAVNPGALRDVVASARRQGQLASQIAADHRDVRAVAPPSGDVSSREPTPAASFSSQQPIQ